MEELGHCLPQVFRRSNLAKGFQAAWVRQHWSDYVGEQLAKFSHVVDLEEGLLRVAGRNAPVMQELHMLVPQIRDTINEELGGPVVREIKITTGAPRKNTVETYIPGYNLPKKIPMQEGVLSPQAVSYIDERLADVTNLALKEQLRTLAVSIAKRKHYRKQHNLKDCPICRSPLDKGERFCYRCRNKEKRRVIINLRRELIRQPALKYDELNAIIPCTMDECIEARRECLQFFIQQLYQEEPPMSLRYVVAMLLTGKRLHELTDEKVCNLTDRYTLAAKKKWESSL